MILPQMRTPDFDIELFTEDTAVQLLSSPDERKVLGDILKDPRTPVLAFTGTLYREIRYLVEQHKSSELAVFLTIKRLSTIKPHWLAFDFFMPKQRISSAEVVMDGPDCEQYFDALQKMDYFRENGLHRNIAHLHSHAQFGVFWSKTDDTEQFSRDELGFHDDYRLFVVVNAKGDIKFSYVGYKPVLHRVDGATCVLYSCPEYAQELTKARKEELDKIADGAMMKRQPVTFSSNYTGRIGYGTGVGTQNKRAAYGYGSWEDFYGPGAYNYGHSYDDADGYWDNSTGIWRTTKPATQPVAKSGMTVTPLTATYSYTAAFNAFRDGLKDEDDLFGNKVISEEEVNDFAHAVVARNVTVSAMERVTIKELLPMLYSECIRNIQGIDAENVSEMAKTLGAYINGLLFVANNSLVLSEIFDGEIGEIGYRLEPRTIIPIGDGMTDLLLTCGFPKDLIGVDDFIDAFINDLIQYSDSFFINDEEDKEVVGA